MKNVVGSFVLFLCLGALWVPQVEAAIVATASADDGHGPVNTLDGSLASTSRWSAYGGGQWIQYNLGEVRQLEAVDIAFYAGDRRIQYFDIELATNEADWRTVYSGGSSGATLDFQRFSFAPGSARYIRIIGYGNTSNDWNSLTEVEFIYAEMSGGAGTVSPTPDVGVLASGDDGNVAENTLDGNPSDASHWAAYGTDQWIRYDLGEEQELEAVDIAFYAAERRYQYFDIYVAGAEGDWLQVFSGSSDGVDTGMQRFGLLKQPTRFICITAKGNSVDDSNALNEVGFVYSPLGPIQVSASAHDGNGPENTLDGSTEAGSRWSAYGSGQWIQYDLGSIRQLEAVDIAFYAGDRRLQYFDIEVATSEVDWRTVYSGASNGATLEFQRFSVVPVSARYVRITGYGNSRHGWNSLTEVDLILNTAK